MSRLWQAETETSALEATLDQMRVGLTPVVSQVGPSEERTPSAEGIETASPSCRDKLLYHAEHSNVLPMDGSSKAGQSACEGASFVPAVPQPCATLMPATDCASPCSGEGSVTGLTAEMYGVTAWDGPDALLDEPQLHAAENSDGPDGLLEGPQLDAAENSDGPDGLLEEPQFDPAENPDGAASSCKSDRCSSSGQSSELTGTAQGVNVFACSDFHSGENARAEPDTDCCDHVKLDLSGTTDDAAHVIASDQTFARSIQSSSQASSEHGPEIACANVTPSVFHSASSQSYLALPPFWVMDADIGPSSSVHFESAF